MNFEDRCKIQDQARIPMARAEGILRGLWIQEKREGYIGMRRLIAWQIMELRQANRQLRRMLRT